MPSSKSSSHQLNEIFVIRHMDNVRKATGVFMDRLSSIGPDDMDAIKDATLNDIAVAQKAEASSLLQLQ